MTAEGQDRMALSEKLGQAEKVIQRLTFARRRVAQAIPSSHRPPNNLTIK